MKSGSFLNIDISIKRVLLLIFGVSMAVMLLFLGVRSSRGASGPDVNKIAAREPQAEPESTPVSFETPPDGMAWTANGELIPFDEVGRPSSAVSSSGVVSAASSGSHYYLTDANFNSDEALTACAAGYHMASMWEIIDPSNLVYDANHPDAHAKADSGQGPPSFWYGRVRTGQDASTSATAGTGNCNNWASVNTIDSGVFVRLSRTWETPPAEIGGIWEVTSFTCDVTGPVWCVGD